MINKLLTAIFFVLLFGVISPTAVLAYDGTFDASNASYDTTTRTLNFDISNMSPEVSTYNMEHVRMVGIYNVSNNQYPLDEYQTANSCWEVTHCELFLGNTEGTYTQENSFKIVIFYQRQAEIRQYLSNQTYTYEELFTTSAPVPPVPVSFTDDFTDIDGTLLGMHNNNWTVAVGSGSIQNNRFFASNPTHIYLPQPTTDQCAAFDFEYPLTGRTELYLRSNDTPDLFTQHGYYFLVDDYPPGSGNFHMADKYDWIGSNVPLNYLSSGTHTFRGCVLGTQLRGYIDGVLISSAWARNNYAVGYPRLRFSGGNGIDNFVYDNGTDLQVTPTNTPTPTPVPTYELTGTVYVDTNENGSQDNGEIGYSGATVSLNTGATSTTDSNGNYVFSNLSAATYTETLTVPASYEATTSNPTVVAVNANTTQNFGIALASQPIGNPTPGDTEDSSNRNIMNGTKFTVGAVGGTVDSMSVYVGDVDTAPNDVYQLAIYTNKVKANGDAIPGTLVAQTTTGTLTANSWNTLPISATFNAYTTYWLMYNTKASSDDLNNLYYTAAGPEVGVFAARTFGTWPTTYPNNPTLTNQKFSIYANFTPNGPAPTLLLGNDVVEENQDSNTAGSAEAFQYTALTTGSASTLAVYLSSDNAATRVRVGIYSDNNGNPGTLLSQAEISTPVDDGWNPVSIPSINITQGTTYWIAVLSPQGRGIVRFRDKASGGTSVGSSQTNLTTLPATWTTGQTWTTTDLSAYLY